LRWQLCRSTYKSGKRMSIGKKLKIPGSRACPSHRRPTLSLVVAATPAPARRRAGGLALSLAHHGGRCALGPAARRRRPAPVTPPSVLAPLSRKHHCLPLLQALSAPTSPRSCSRRHRFSHSRSALLCYSVSLHFCSIVALDVPLRGTWVAETVLVELAVLLYLYEIN